MMEINVGKFFIENDKNQFTLFENRKKGMFPGLPQPADDETTKEVIGYYSTFESCLKAIPTKLLLRCNAKSIEEVIVILKEYRGLIANALKGA